jgi:catechol 2,3-dioxygenase-like lactoylglutathione lyase family enzyme
MRGEVVERWVSLPVADDEARRLLRALEGARRDRHGLVLAPVDRLAFVDMTAWTRFALPVPPSPIVTVFSADAQALGLALGGRWEAEPAERPWGVVAGFLRLPSGLLLEVVERARR